MRAFAEAWPDLEFVSQALLAQWPWYHQLAPSEKLDNTDSCRWYAQKSIENHRPRNVLVMQIESGLHQRQGAAITNFATTLSKLQSDLARESIKDPF
ncbi:DUF1016 N-terminal domain-containing protein [Shewanella sp.]|uniref:DUF1016 N-terminal domain-containing protein n=1 Tax=Shewanella sp. TaxID=50422 RepID=UPI003F36416C